VPVARGRSRRRARRHEHGDRNRGRSRIRGGRPRRGGLPGSRRARCGAARRGTASRGTRIRARAETISATVRWPSIASQMRRAGAALGELRRRLPIRAAEDDPRIVEHGPDPLHLVVTAHSPQEDVLHTEVHGEAWGSASACRQAELGLLPVEEAVDRLSAFAARRRVSSSAVTASRFTRTVPSARRSAPGASGRCAGSLRDLPVPTNRRSGSAIHLLLPTGRSRRRSCTFALTRQEQTGEHLGRSS